MYCVKRVRERDFPDCAGEKNEDVIAVASTAEELVTRFNVWARTVKGMPLMKDMRSTHSEGLSYGWVHYIFTVEEFDQLF